MPKEFEASCTKSAISSEKLAGGYLTWRLIPAGPRVDVGKESEPITGKFTELHCDDQVGKTDIYKPNKDFDFDPSEKVAISGPNDNNELTLHGETAGDSTWELQKTA